MAFLDNRPELHEHLAFAWQAFLELSTDRPVGLGGAGPIPWAAIDRYARRYRLDDVDAFEIFMTLVRAADAAWLGRQQELRGDD